MTTNKVNGKCSHTPIKIFESTEDMVYHKDEIPYYFNKKKIFEHIKDPNIIYCNEDTTCEIIFRNVQGFSIVIGENNIKTRVIAEI